MGDNLRIQIVPSCESGVYLESVAHRSRLSLSAAVEKSKESCSPLKTNKIYDTDLD